MLEAMHAPLKKQLRPILLAALMTTGALSSDADKALGDEWMTWASTYTHEPTAGQRIDQYALPEQPMAPQRADFVRSGFRHYRSTLQAGQSADNIHIVEQWGRPVVPYAQWRFPYRPYSVPYDAWGPQAPYGIFNGAFFGRRGFPGSPQPAVPPTGNPGTVGPEGLPGQSPNFLPRGFPLTPPYRNEPWFDGTYPSAPPLDPRSDEEFFYKPSRN